MAKREITRKGIGSLTRRVVWTCLALLVIPLFLHSLFLYRQEYQQTLKDIELTLKVIGQSQVALIEERINLEWDRLDAIDSADTPVAQKLGVEVIPLPKGISGYFVQADPERCGLVVGKEVDGGQAFVIVTLFSELLDQLSHFQHAPYPVSIAFIGQNKEILAGKVAPDALSVKVPVSQANFSVELTVPKESLKEIHIEEYLMRFLALLFFIGVVGGLLVYLLTRRIGRPLRKLCDTMARVSEGGIHARYTPEWMGFELNELGKQFNSTLDALLEQQAQAEKARFEREKLAQELRIGREIQMSLLPTRLPGWKELDIATGFSPATEVSGDFYDFFEPKEGKLFIVIADTAGKGISACLYALDLRSFLRSFSFIKQDLSEILVEANRLFWMDARQSGMFVTLWAGIYDRKKRILTYASQGHPPALLKRGEHIRELKTRGMAMGAQDHETIATEKISLEIGDELLLYTDGIIEAHNLEKELFGARKLHDLFLRSKSDSAEKTVQEVIRASENFRGEAPQHDDIACLSIRFF